MQSQGHAHNEALLEVNTTIEGSYVLPLRVCLVQASVLL